MKKDNIAYTLVMTPDQASHLCTACEFYSRMLLGQFQELISQLVSLSDEKYVDKAEIASEKLLEARNILLPELSHSWGHSYGVGHNKDADIVWELYEVVRHTKAWTEHPEGGDTVDFGPPISFSGEELARCTAASEDENEYIEIPYETISAADKRQLLELLSSTLLNAFTKDDFYDTLAIIRRVANRFDV